MDKWPLKLGLIILGGFILLVAIMVTQAVALKRDILRDLSFLEKLETITDSKTMQRIYYLGQKYGYQEVYTVLMLKKLDIENRRHPQKLTSPCTQESKPSQDS